jgi:hypothetical protein
MSVAQFGLMGIALGVVWFTLIAVVAIWVQRRENVGAHATAS